MAVTSLANFDELLLQCRDLRSRAFIAEAIACYHVGAFRSSIVATWTAVVYDYVHKLTELRDSGNGAARDQLARFESARTATSPDQALGFERTVIEHMQKTFQLLSRETREDIERLHKDRHRCAHPSMQTEEEPFVPPAELARYHIYSAVSILLSQPPVQGQAAEELVWSRISSTVFPTEQDAAIRMLQETPLVRARDGLVRRIVRRVFYGFIQSEVYPEKLRLGAALDALFDQHRETCEAFFGRRPPDVLASIGDEQLPRLLELLRRVPVIWSLASPNMHGQLQRFVQTCDANEHGATLLDTLSIEPLRRAASERLPEITLADLESPSFVSDRDPLVRAELIRRFAESENYYAARQFLGGLIPSLVDSVSEPEIQALLEAYTANNQINEARGVEDVYVSILARVTKENGMLAGPLRAMAAQLAGLFYKDDAAAARLSVAVQSALDRLTSPPM